MSLASYTECKESVTKHVIESVFYFYIFLCPSKSIFILFPLGYDSNHLKCCPQEMLHFRLLTLTYTTEGYVTSYIRVLTRCNGTMLKFAILHLMLHKRSMLHI